MKFTGKITDVGMSRERKPRVTLDLNENSFFDFADELMAKEKLDLEMKEFREKRSLDANAYAWVLIGKIAKELGHKKEEIYRESIRNVGDYITVCVKDEKLDQFCKGWESGGLGWMVEKFPSKLDGCTNVNCYRGSSDYDTAQMSRLIDNLVQDAKALGIQTETPDQIAKMLSLWEGK